MEKRKIIIDTDPGVDDTMAIFFALESPQLEVIGLTTIFGNVHTVQATDNALSLLELAGRSDIPVAKGADEPIASVFRGPAAVVHGDYGQGDIRLPPPTTRAVSEHAAVFIIEQVMAAPGEITLVPVGPLTNIALALRLEPRIADRVREVVLMGGAALAPGNVNPAAEANISNDPEAADLVFSAGWPVTMVGLDVTLKVNMTPEHLAVYGQSQKATSQHIAKITPLYQKFIEGLYPGLRGIHVHDSTAISYLRDPSLFTVRQCPVVVETQGISRGKTWVWTESQLVYPWSERPLANICVGVDAERAIAAELATV